MATLSSIITPSNVVAVAPGASGNVLTSNGTTWQSTAPSGAVISNTQTFTSSGTWTKPSGANWVRVEVWGAGGSGRGAAAGNAGGGGGGAYAVQIFPASSLGSTETVTIGAGGTAVSGGTNGNTGGNTTFGSWLTGYGGAGGTTSVGGAGGAYTAGGSTAGGSNYNDASGALQQANAGSTGGSSYFGGAGGGGAGSLSGGAGGSTRYGGAGGAGAITGTATSGSQPGGGGGGNYNGTSGAGGNGKVVVNTW